MMKNELCVLTMILSVAVTVGCDSSSASLCTNTCRFANDGDCDDGGEGSDFSGCELGSDCNDCGAREGVGSGSVSAPASHDPSRDPAYSGSFDEGGPTAESMAMAGDGSCPSGVWCLNDRSGFYSQSGSGGLIGTCTTQVEPTSCPRGYQCDGAISSEPHGLQEASGCRHPTPGERVVECVSTGTRCNGTGPEIEFCTDRPSFMPLDMFRPPTCWDMHTYFQVGSSTHTCRDRSECGAPPACNLDEEQNAALCGETGEPDAGTTGVSAECSAQIESSLASLREIAVMANSCTQSCVSRFETCMRSSNCTDSSCGNTANTCIVGCL